MSDPTALITAITALVAAIGTLVGLFIHVKSPDPHPTVVTPIGKIDNGAAEGTPKV